MGIRSGSSIKLKNRASVKKLEISPYVYLPWVEDEYDEHPWYDVTLTREILHDAYDKQLSAEKSGGFKGKVKRLMSAGLRSEAYFLQAGPDRIWGLDIDAIVDNHHAMLRAAPEGMARVTIPEDMRVELFQDRIVVSSWQKDQKRADFVPVYVVRFPTSCELRPGADPRLESPEPFPCELEEDIYPGLKELTDKDPDRNALFEVLRLIFSHYSRTIVTVRGDGSSSSS